MPQITRYHVAALAVMVIAVALLIYTNRPDSEDLQTEIVAPLTPPSEEPAVPVLIDFNFEDARAAFEQMKLGDPMRREALQEIAAKMAKQDATAALTWADNLSVPRERLDALSIIIASGAHGASGAAAAVARAIEESGVDVNLVDLRSADGALHLLVKNLLDTWVPEKAFAWADKNLDGDAKRSSTGVMIAKLSRTNPEAAAHRIESMPFGPERTAATASLAAGWVYKSGAEALRYVESIGDERDRKTALDRLASSWPYSDQAGVVSQIETLPAGETRDALLGAMASHVVKDSPAEAIAYADQIEGEVRIAATRNLVRRWAEVDPNAASEHVSQLEDPGERARLAGVLVKSWLGSEPDAAAEWVAAYDGEGGAVVTKDFMAEWIHIDPKAASTWLGTLEQGPSRDAAVHVLIVSESSNDPESALRWAETLSDPDRRRQTTGWLKKEISGDQ